MATNPEGFQSLGQASIYEVARVWFFALPLEFMYPQTSLTDVRYELPEGRGEESTKLLCGSAAGHWVIVVQSQLKQLDR